MTGPVVPTQYNVGSAATAASNGVAWPTTLATAGTFNNGGVPIGLQGNVHYAIGGILSRTGTVVVTPYLDLAGNIAVGTASSAAIAAGTAFVLDGNVGTGIVQSIGIKIINGSASLTATLTNPILVLQSS
jgi:hypothetical protein